LRGDLFTLSRCNNSKSNDFLIALISYSPPTIWMQMYGGTNTGKNYTKLKQVICWLV